MSTTIKPHAGYPQQLSVKNNKQLQIGMYFEIISEIENTETIAIGGKI